MSFDEHGEQHRYSLRTRWQKRMNELLITIGNGLFNVMNFSGRTSRREFWIYAGFVTACVWLSTVVAIMPPYAHRAMHGGLATYSLDIKPILWPTITVATIWIALLSGATVRRLRDGGRSSLWAALPLPFLAMGFTLTSALFDAVARSLSPPMMVFYGLLLNNILFLCALLVLGFFLVLPTHGRDAADAVTRPANCLVTSERSKKPGRPVITASAIAIRQRSAPGRQTRFFEAFSCAKDMLTPGSVLDIAERDLKLKAALRVRRRGAPATREVRR